MKARPILMHARSVQNLLAGRKTQTRRIVKFPPRMLDDGAPPSICHGFGDWGRRGVGWDFYVAGAGNEVLDCPYGVAAGYARPGDLLWVREAWRLGKGYDGVKGSGIDGAALSGSILIAYEGATPPGMVVGRYRHARFMPRWASRLTLELTDVRVERVQDCSEADALAEGVVIPSDAATPQEIVAAGGTQDDVLTARHMFEYLWNDTNGPGAWERNDWVWALTFVAIRRNVDDVIREVEKEAAGGV